MLPRGKKWWMTLMIKFSVCLSGSFCIYVLKWIYIYMQFKNDDILPLYSNELLHTKWCFVLWYNRDIVFCFCLFTYSSLTNFICEAEEWNSYSIIYLGIYIFYSILLNNFECVFSHSLSDFRAWSLKTSEYIHRTVYTWWDTFMRYEIRYARPHHPCGPYLMGSSWIWWI